MNSSLKRKKERKKESERKKDRKKERKKERILVECSFHEPGLSW